MDSLRKVIEIMQHLENNLEKDTKEKLRRRFGKNFVLFERFCMGGEEPYAEDKGNYLTLNQKGVRKLYELRRIVAEEDLAKLTIFASGVIAIFTIIQIMFQILG